MISIRAVNEIKRALFEMENILQNQQLQATEKLEEIASLKKDIANTLKDKNSFLFHRYIVKENRDEKEGRECYHNVLITLDLDKAIECYQKDTNRRIEIWLSDDILVSEYWGDETSFDQIKTTIEEYYY